MDWIHLTRNTEQVEGSHGHGDEPSGSIKCWEFLEWLRDWQLLTKDSAP
jgi:hypothetical protein